jgi:RNA polymerase sigma-70 factor (ECF subfamily)
MTPDERFAALFARTHQPLLGYALRRVSDPADAADVVAETFLVAWRRLDDVPEGEAARPWLFGVARRVLANLYRGERRRDALADRLREQLTEVVVEAPDPDTPALAALRRLPDADQEVLRLVAWEELARDEIALVLGVSRATVRVRLHRARRRLREQMDRMAQSPPDEHEARLPSAAGRTARVGRPRVALAATTETEEA